MKPSSPLRPAPIGAALLLALAAVPAHALADAAPGGQTPPSGPENETALPEVKATATPVRPGSPKDVVRTGSKTDTPLRDLPASVAVVPKALLKEQGAYTMNDAMRNVSGVQAVMGGGYGFANNFTSRGLSVNFLRDDLPDGSAQNGYFRTVYDIERIEVLKGPGSALFGSGGPGGSINVVTKKPQDIFGLKAGTTVGSFDTYNGYADITGPIMRGVAGRLIADSENSAGFRGLERSIKEVLPTLAWNWADDKTLTLDLDARDIDIKPDNFGIVFDSHGKIAPVSRKTRYYSPMNKSDQQVLRGTLTHDWKIADDLSMKTAFSYDDRDLSFIRNAGANGGNAANAMTGRTLRQQSDDARYLVLQNELVWKTRSGPLAHTVLAGFEYKDTNIDTVRVGFNLPNIANILNPVVTETSLAGLAPVVAQGYDRKIASESFGVYAQDQIDLGEHWKARLGLRNDHVDYSDKGLEGKKGFREISRTKDLTTGSAGAVYQPSPEWSLYAGYTTGAFINLATEATALATEPEKSEQFEIGSKTSLFRDRLDINLALFNTRRENYFVTLPGALSPTPDGKDESRGIELDIGAHPLPGLSLTGNAVWMDPKVESRILASNAILGVLNQSVHGKRPTGTTQNAFGLWGSYELQSGLARGLTFGLGVNHKGASFADNLNLYKVPSYTTVDAAISYRQPRWEVALNLRNLADATYYTNPTFIGALPGDPRSVYATLRLNFN